METDDLLQQPLKEGGVEAEEGEEKDSAMIPRREVKEKKQKSSFCSAIWTLDEWNMQ